MSYEQIRRTANRLRRVPLQAVLESIGAERDRHDKAKWHTSQGVLSVTGMKFMNWNQAVGGGGAIDLVMHLHQTDFKDALQWLCQQFPDQADPDGSWSPRVAALRLPPRDDSKLHRVERYLVEERCLPSTLTDRLIETAALYADARANAVFVLFGKEGQPVGAELRGTSQTPWRSMAAGSRKDRGYFAVGSTDAETLILCESAIDAVSCHALHPETLCLTTSGASPSPRWLPALIRRGYRVYCGYDADTTGDTMAKALAATHPTVRRIRPARKDWNDVLRARLCPT